MQPPPVSVAALPLLPVGEDGPFAAEQLPRCDQLVAVVLAGEREPLWVPRTVSWRLISAFSDSQPRGHRPHLAQHDRPLWPFDSPICYSLVC